MDSNYQADVVVVGSGAAGMTAAITAARSGMKVVLVEKSNRWGGSTARSGGGIWIPGNDVLAASAGIDSIDDARRYLHALAGDVVDVEKLDTYIDRGPEALRALCEWTPLRLMWVDGYSDYLPELPGGRAEGRSVEPRPFDVRTLGDDYATMEPFYTKTPLNVVVTQGDYKWLSTGTRHWRGPVRMLKIAGRTAIARLRGQRLVGLGGALVGPLMIGVRQAGVSVRLGCGMRELIQIDGQVTGVVLDTGEQLIAKRGVILGCGGFDHNEAMRRQYHRAPAGTTYSLGATANTGDGITAATEVGAGVDLMDDAWWAPSIPLASGPWFALSERSLPRSLIVNDRGVRFMNESLPYVEATHAMFGGEHGSGAGPAENLPAWMIFDQGYRDRYVFAGRPAKTPLPQKWFDSGALVRADSIPELAVRLSLPGDALAATIARFNEFARAGVDEDFGRGASAYDRYYGDITNKPNPGLGVLDKPPYYAAEFVPADLGTKGGLVTDARARVLRADASVIGGLYASGNVSSAVMGHTYAGPGATIGPAIVFGYLAARDVVEAASR
ncbi:3-ketosteroid delta(1)-dehydrogenase [Gordonia araii NBRC 100433]|uniref:3-oxosteroid 1-dehydrogenase n=1 Tax=Gordonia araii NBRC 100433 TaxID=1073574 RepID=G7GZ47_9ACTN|nr:3-oxosteroid 1-dehydrogenase [Gordonia araii]NNG97079.1 3-oxosteroid 1-dehydrogenase [Gordonia araii NBRC 100433]GAB08872.1 3-ketosteroid delta(1)-dehydrogenase [Gordonia araii NBRC 100433]